MRIIPAIDIIDGKCVRLTQGNYNQKKIYNENPLEVAKAYEDNGIKYLHLVDLDGAKSKRIINYKILEELSTKTSLKIDFGGGLKTRKDLKIAFESGASQVTGGSIAVNEPKEFLSWLKEFGNQKIILGADVLDGKIAIDAWQSVTENGIADFLGTYTKEGIKYVICTDVSKDGMLQGAADELYKSILSEFKIHLIASGGISSIDDILKMKEIGCEGVIIGKAIYENKISLKELSKLI